MTVELASSDEERESTPPADETGQVTTDAASTWPKQLTAVTPGRLAAPTSPEQLKALMAQEWWISAQKTSLDWQSISVWASFWELLAPRVERGRGRELAGLIADGGERLALALSAITEAELWSACRADPPSRDNDLEEMQARSVRAAHEMCQRSMAELAAYYVLAAGHLLANVTARALALDTRLHHKLFDTLGSWYPAGSSDPQDWASLNRDTARRLRRVAREANGPIARTLAGPITTLLMSPAWADLDRLRGVQYHRRRPQSAGIDGVPLGSPWTFTSRSASFAGSVAYTDGDGLARHATDLARRTLKDLTAAMEVLLANILATIEEVKAITPIDARSEAKRSGH